MRGVLLAGGNGSRLYPLTQGTSKHLLSVFDKPMVYYPFSLFMLAGIREIMIVSKSEFIDGYEKLLGNGECLGMTITYGIQDEPLGIPDGLRVASDFLGSDNVLAVLGDNLLWAQGLQPLMRNLAHGRIGATVFGYRVLDASRFGVAEVDSDGSILALTEKPPGATKGIAVPGIYSFDNSVISKVRTLTASSRGELEVMDLLELYRNDELLNLQMLGRGCVWFDMGTPEALLDASKFVETIQTRQGYRIGCLEELALRNCWITADELMNSIESRGLYGSYDQYLARIVDECRMNS